MRSLKALLAKPFAKRIQKKVSRWANNPIQTQEKVFQDLIEIFRENDQMIISSKYRNVYGPPTLFSRVYFDKLLELEGDRGAKALIKSQIDNVIFYNWDRGLIDIDHKDHLIHLIKN